VRKQRPQPFADGVKLQQLDVWTVEELQRLGNIKIKVNKEV
jgi:hypothetical protein